MKKRFKFLPTFVIAALAVFLPAKVEATARQEQEEPLGKSIVGRIETVREAFAQLESETGKESPPDASSQIAQWYNWPNWGNWGNWPNWPNY